MLRAVAGTLSRAKAEAIATVIQHLLQIIGVVDEEHTPEADQVLAEMRELCRLYISSRLGDVAGGDSGHP